MSFRSHCHTDVFKIITQEVAQIVDALFRAEKRRMRLRIFQN